MSSVSSTGEALLSQRGTAQGCQLQMPTEPGGLRPVLRGDTQDDGQGPPPTPCSRFGQKGPSRQPGTRSRQPQNRAPSQQRLPYCVRSRGKPHSSPGAFGLLWEPVWPPPAALRPPKDAGAARAPAGREPCVPAWGRQKTAGRWRPSSGQGKLGGLTGRPRWSVSTRLPPPWASGGQRGTEPSHPTG